MNIFDRLKKVRTPHGDNLKHFRNLYGYFSAATAIVLALKLGVVAAGPLWLTIVAGLVTAAIALVGGIFVTMVVRSIFGLIQTGRLIQYAGFFLASYASLEVSAHLLDAFTLPHAALAGLALFVLAFGAATAFGEIPTRGRTWLPRRHPRRASR